MKHVQHLTIQLLLLALLALVSGYRLPDFADVDWATVLFLTPLGLGYNFLWPSAITSFYADPARSQLVASGAALVVMCALYVGLLANAWWYVRRVRAVPRGRR